MDFKTILTNVNWHAPGHVSARTAASLASRFGARLVGVSAIREPVPFATPEEQQKLRDQLRSLEIGFQEQSSGSAKRHWHGEIDLPSEVIIRQMRRADLLVLEGSVGSQFETGEIILRAGRPVLLVPTGSTELDLDTVLIAWKDTREARRALRDSIPFLQQSKRVVVAGFDERGLGSARLKDELDLVGEFLSGHQVDIAGKIVAEASTGVGQELLRLAKSEVASLVVAGAYGHSRLGEWLFGGVTSDLLSQADICCLVSH